MKYKIIVEKEKKGLYMAHCPLIADIRVTGNSVDAALSNFMKAMLCYLHDPEAEFEIVCDGQRHAGYTDTQYKAV